MQHRSCIQESRIPLHVSGMRTRMRMRTKTVRHIEMFGMKAIVAPYSDAAGGSYKKE